MFLVFVALVPPLIYVSRTILLHRIAELTKQELLKRHSPRVANAVVDVNPLGSAGLGENSPDWART